MEQLRSIVTLLISARIEYDVSEVKYQNRSFEIGNPSTSRDEAFNMRNIVSQFEDKIIGLTFLIDDDKAKEYISLVTSKRQLEDELKHLYYCDDSMKRTLEIVGSIAAIKQLIKAYEGYFAPPIDLKS